MEFKIKHFVKICFLCFMYFTFMGPFVIIFAVFDGFDLTLYHNLGFTWKGIAGPIRIFQTVNWLVTMAIPVMLIHRCIETDNWSLIDLH